MTLRNVGGWLQDFGHAVERDIGLMFTENIIDWPLWTVAFVVVLIVLALVILNDLIPPVKDHSDD